MSDDTEQQEPSTELARVDDQQQSPVLGDLPTVPAADEMRAMMQLANVFSAAELVPRALRQKPNDCLLVLMTARDLGLSMTTAFRECHVIEGRVTASPKLKLAIVRARGIGKVWPDPGNNSVEATWYGVRADTPDVRFEYTFTWRDAQVSDMVSVQCSGPAEHKLVKTDKGKIACRHGCKTNYITHPRRMMSWRALGFLMDEGFGEVGTGLYSPDELGAVVDENGRPVIDVAEVGVPEGMDAPRAVQQADRAKARTAQEEVVPKEARQELTERIKALPEPARVALRERWAQPRSQEQGAGPMLPLDDAGKPSVNLLDARSMKTARALVSSFEREVQAGKHATAEEAPVADPDPNDPVEGVTPETITAEVAGMDWDTVQTELAGYGIEGGQDEDDDRARLVAEMCQEMCPEGPGEATEPAAGGDPSDGGSDSSESEPETDWAPILQAAAVEAEKAGQALPGEVAQRLIQEVSALKNVHHLRKALVEAGVADEGPPELRRMRLYTARAKAWSDGEKGKGDDGTD